MSRIIKDNAKFQHLIKGGNQQKISKELLDNIQSLMKVEDLKRVIENIAVACAALKEENDALRETVNGATSYLFAAAMTNGGELRMDYRHIALSGGKDAVLDKFDDEASRQTVIRAKLKKEG